MADDELATLLATCAGKTFADRRDMAIIRLLLDTGGRLSEITMLNLDDLDLRRDLVLVRGKGDKQRAIPFGEKTGQALTRYLWVRARHAGPACRRCFWPSEDDAGWHPTVSRSCCGGVGNGREFSGCTRTGCGTRWPMSGSSRAATRPT